MEMDCLFKQWIQANGLLQIKTLTLECLDPSDLYYYLKTYVQFSGCKYTRALFDGYTKLNVGRSQPS